MSELRDVVVQHLSELHLPVCQCDVLLADANIREVYFFGDTLLPCNVLKLQPLRNIERKGDEKTWENEGHHVKQGGVTEIK